MAQCLSNDIRYPYLGVPYSSEKGAILVEGPCSFWLALESTGPGNNGALHRITLATYLSMKKDRSLSLFFKVFKSFEFLQDIRSFTDIYNDIKDMEQLELIPTYPKTWECTIGETNGVTKITVDGPTAIWIVYESALTGEAYMGGCHKPY